MKPALNNQPKTRFIAQQILLKVETQEAFLDRALDSALKRTALDPRDKAFVTELVYGTTRKQIYLDFILSSFSNQPIKKLPIALLITLRLAVYQLLFLRTSEHAVVNEAVNDVRVISKPLTGFANAILRRVIREKNNLPTPLTDEVTTSMPRWILAEVAKQRGEDQTLLWAEANQQVPPVSIRVNLARISKEALIEQLREAGIEIEAPSVFPETLWLRQAGSIEQLPGFAEGLFTVQDAAATLIAKLLNPAPTAVVLDTCAAPGGKTLHVAQSVAKVIAVDVHPGKLGLIRENAQRLGLTNVETRALDATAGLLQEVGKVDAVIVDAPCSGLGTLRRHPELRFRAQEKLKRLVPLQEQLLNAAAKTVKPGGVLVYTVCTLTEEEGPQQVERFLQAHPEFKLSSAVPDDLQPFMQGGYLWTWTDRDGCDGFFAARLSLAPESKLV